MSAVYQPLKFQHFDVKGNPKQHMAHFVETCNNAGTYGDYLIKKFVRSLKGNAFDWYTDLEAGYVYSWDQLEQEFLNHFYSTRRTVSMIELTNTHQRNGEPVIDFINRWRNANLNYKDRISEAWGIEMCIQGMHWGLRYILQGNKAGTFEELSTRAHDMELSMASAGNERLPIYELHKGNEKQEVKKWAIFEELLELNLIELPEMKRANEDGKTNDLNYCKYHRLVRHPLEKCFVFNDKVIDLAREKKIVLEDEKASANQVSITFGSFSPDELCGFKKSKDEELLENDKAKVNQPDYDKGWTLMTHRRHHKRSPRKESIEQPARKMMVKRPRRWNLVKYLKKAKVEGEVEKKIVADDEPFTEAESHFADANFYLKNRIVKELIADDGIKSNNNEPTTKREEVTTGEAKSVTKEVQPNMNKSYKGNIASYGKKNVALPTKRTDEGFDPNAYRLFAKIGYNPNESSKLGQLLSEAAMRQPCEGLGYKQPSPVHISLRRADSNYITAEDESVASNKPSVFDRLGKSPVGTSVFERLGPLKKGNKSQRNFQSIRTPVPPKIQKISNNFQSLVPSRMSQQTKLVVSCKEVLKVKPYTMVYTKEYDEDEESVGSSYHVTIQGENGVPYSLEDNVELKDVSPCYHISFNDGDPQEDEDAKDVPPELEEGVKTTVDALKEVNLGTDKEPRPTYLSALLEVDEESTFIELLKEFRDIFAWSYKEMPDLDPKVAAHHLVVKNGARPIKQAQRRFRPDLVPLIETEVNKFIEAGFIHEVKYPTWVSSIVPIRKANGQIRVCVDFRDLNNACPKDEFSLPIPELMIDATTGYEAMSFMDGSSGYNQIRMAPKDEKITAFRTPKGIYCYKIPQKAIKGEALADFLADQPIPDDWELTDELPNEDTIVIEV
ncbi:uncharacterized protein [Nicotiana sylvestris]|uniref:uncharacterized protein n=1 Tax=Nicotiana sylvestris TaxID=4096 RepID=UPI00388C3ED0